MASLPCQRHFLNPLSQIIGTAITTVEDGDYLDILQLEVLYDDFEDIVVRLAAATQDSALNADAQVENFICRILLPQLAP